MLRLEKVTIKNAGDLLRLNVAESQRGFCASNSFSLAEAYTAVVENHPIFPFGVYDGDTLVGFVMIDYDYKDHFHETPQIAKGNYLLSRLMIDEKYQRKGYGRGAVELALDFIRSFPCGKAEYCWLDVEPENEVARKLYRSFGFVELGEMEGQGIVAVLKL